MPSTHAATVSVQHLEMTFTARGDRQRVLDDINLEIAPGEFFVIVGPSGCGKTTLLKILQGLSMPTGGKVMVGGHAIKGPGTDRGFVFQHDSLYPWRTVLKNVVFGLELQGVSVREARPRAEAMIDLVGLKG